MDPAICASDVAVDSHASLSMLRELLYQAKTDLFGKGVFIYPSRTDSVLCPVTAVLGYMYLTAHPAGEGPLFISEMTYPSQGSVL